MAELSDATYDVIAQRVTVTITDVQLQSELIDHCCCAVEELMNLGMPCEEAIDRAFLRLAPDGLHEIEDAFNHIQTPLILMIMKKTLYFSGFIATFCILIGLMFKIMHWPGATAILVAGNLSLSVCLIAILYGLLTNKTTLPRITFSRILFGIVGGMLLASGIFFKIMHWPGANILLVIGMFLITFIFLPIFFWQLYRSEMK
jgi:hypothetical protein